MDSFKFILRLADLHSACLLVSTNQEITITVCTHLCMSTSLLELLNAAPVTGRHQGRHWETH